MSVSHSRMAYMDCYDLYDKALESEHGIRMRMETEKAMHHMQLRMHQARAINRKDNAAEYAIGEPLHGASVYDRLMVRKVYHSDGFWLYVEPHGINLDNAQIEYLSGEPPLLELESTKVIEHEPQTDVLVSPQLLIEHVKRRL